MSRYLKASCAVGRTSRAGDDEGSENKLSSDACRARMRAAATRNVKSTQSSQLRTVGEGATPNDNGRADRVPDGCDVAIVDIRPSEDYPFLRAKSLVTTSIIDGVHRCGVPSIGHLDSGDACRELESGW